MTKKNIDESSYKIKTFRSIEEIEKIRDVWESLQHHPNADIDFYLNIVNSREEILRPHIIVLYFNGNPEAMIIGRIEELIIDIKVGYTTLFKPKVKALSIIYGGILGNIQDGMAHAFASQLIRLLNERETDVIFFSNIEMNSIIYKIANEKQLMICRDKIIVSKLHWKMAMPETIDDLYKKIKSKHRSWIRGRKRKLEKDFPGKVDLFFFNDAAHIDRLCIDAEKVACKTYQRGLGAGFINNDETRRRLQLSGDRGWLRAYILYVDGEPCAFWFGTLYKETFHLDFTGYDQKYRKYEPGTILFVTMIESLCEDEVKAIDFGFGDAFYKQRFGDSSWEEASVYIFGRTARGILLNILRTLTALIVLNAEKIVARYNLREKMKKWWRLRIAPNS